jgi:hypothetical protein
VPCTFFIRRVSCTSGCDCSDGGKPSSQCLYNGPPSAGWRSQVLPVMHSYRTVLHVCLAAFCVDKSRRRLSLLAKHACTLLYSSVYADSEFLVSMTTQDGGIYIYMHFCYVSYILSNLAHIKYSLISSNYNLFDFFVSRLTDSFYSIFFLEKTIFKVYYMLNNTTTKNNNKYIF